jgi:hypothetical protein
MCIGCLGLFICDGGGLLSHSIIVPIVLMHVNGRNMGLLFKLAEEWLTKAQIELKHTLTLAYSIFQ